jgi:hypothetical protein
MKRKLEDIDVKLGDIRREARSANFWHGGSGRDSNAAEG